jgi:hypothetical protein
MTSGEIRNMAKEHLESINVAEKVVSAMKDLVNRQIDSMVRGYGNSVIKSEVEAKITEWMEKNFESFFSNRCSAFVREYLEGKTTSFKNFLETIDKRWGTRAKVKK